jgi:hypothetical protein
MDSIYRARLRCTPTEDSLDEYIVDLLLPKLQSQPRLHAIRRLLVKYFMEALLEVRRMVALPFGKRMQRPQARLCQFLSILGGFDAIQQHDRGIVCPDSNAPSVSRAHRKNLKTCDRRFSTPALSVTRKKPLYKKVI